MARFSKEKMTVSMKGLPRDSKIDSFALRFCLAWTRKLTPRSKLANKPKLYKPHR
jgi:hypothetical protein